MHLILAANWFLDPIVNVITQIVDAIDVVVRNRGWSLVIFALLFKIAFWPLNTKQFMAMMNMQKIAPKLKALQAKYGKSDPQKYQQETMALYKEHGVNPLAGCWPMLVQYPIIISVFYAVTSNEKLYAKAHWLWIGAPFTHHLPLLWGTTILATSLAGTDLVLLALYMLSMYFYSRYATMPSTDPQQAQTQKISQFMVILFPLFLYNAPSGLNLYIFASTLGGLVDTTVVRRHLKKLEARQAAAELAGREK